MSAAHDYPAEYLDFIRTFNAGDYHAAHDVLESLWLEDRQDFYKGLIQVAVGLYHRENGNLAGARSLLRTAAAYLRKYPERYLGLRPLELAARCEGIERELTGCESRSARPGWEVGHNSIHLQLE